MKVSLNWVKFINNKYGYAGDPAVDGVDKLIEKIGAQLGAVDEVIEVGKKYEGALIAKVVSCEKHPNADKLSVCMLDIGKTKPAQVICGAPNVRAGQTVVWLPPGATVPNTFDKDPFVIAAREIRDVVSHGMIASARELALGDDHTGIVVIEDEIKPGTNFAEAFGLDDIVIDIENKMFTHRPDLFGMLGIARELAGIQHKPFKSPEWYREEADLHNDGRKNVLKLSIKNELPELVPRFIAVAIKDVKVEDSPAWLKARLSSVGVRPINTIVDITNYLMLETAQPLHAYDYDKVRTGILGIRESKDGEQLKLLSGKTAELKKGSIVITDGQRSIGLGGIMGGADTEVDEKTRNIILEVANFDMNTTRRTAMEYGLFTDAATRFSKNQSPRQTKAVLVRAGEDIKRIAGGRLASPIIDDKHINARIKPVTVTAEFVNRRLGFELAASEMARLLGNVEFKVKIAGKNLEVTVPFWRTDIKIPEDIVEEVGRLYGYDKLPIDLPSRDLAPSNHDALLDLKSRIREILSRAGGNEVLTYSFIHGNLLEKARQDKKVAYKLANALSPDSQYYRVSLTPSLLDKIHPNQKLGFKNFAIFEINKVHSKSEVGKDGLPVEFDRLAMVITRERTSPAGSSGAPFFDAKRYITYLFNEFGVRADFQPLNKISIKGHKLTAQMVAPFDQSRSAAILAENRMVGVIGEFKAEVSRDFKLPKSCAGFELFISTLQNPASVRYRPLNRYPELEQDFCLRASSELTYAELTEFMARQLEKAAKKNGYIYDLAPLDIYQRETDKGYKQTTWRIKLAHPDRTLTTDESNQLLDKIAGAARKALRAERV